MSRGMASQFAAWRFPSAERLRGAGDAGVQAKRVQEPIRRNAHHVRAVVVRSQRRPAAVRPAAAVCRELAEPARRPKRAEPSRLPVPERELRPNPRLRLQRAAWSIWARSSYGSYSSDSRTPRRGVVRPTRPDALYWHDQASPSSRQVLSVPWDCPGAAPASLLRKAEARMARHNRSTLPLRGLTEDRELRHARRDALRRAQDDEARGAARRCRALAVVDEEILGAVAA